jgi:hypothetical protein
MPFSLRETDRLKYPEDHWNRVYDTLLRPGVEAAHLKCHCDNEDFSSRPIALNIWKKIEDADIILCDVSSSNPNVFIELGWAIRAEKPYVIAMDQLTVAPFDVADLNRFHYDHTLSSDFLEDHISKLARMLRETLLDPDGRWSIVRNLGIASPSVARNARPRCTADIYYYEQGFTREDANVLSEQLLVEGIRSRLLEHSDPRGPDAVFIGSLVEAHDARYILGLIPYEVKYIFRPDYPESDGGDAAGYKVGIGYSSRYNEGRRIWRAEPLPIAPSELAELLDKNNTNTTFHQLLWKVTLRRNP